MNKAIKLLAVITGSGAVCLLVGFLVFTGSIMRHTPSLSVKADGIVVLTGGEYRITEAIKLLGNGKARRLLISGVNRNTSRNALRHLTRHETGQGDGLFDCCIDIGYEALNTIGNAQETRDWAKNWHFSKIIIVTSSYHMPRSLAELGRALPRAQLYSHPVMPSNFRIDSWWRHPGTARLLVSEYVKFLASSVRLGVSRLLQPLEPMSAIKRGSQIRAKL